MSPYDIMNSPAGRIKFMQEIRRITTLKALADETGISLSTLKGVVRRDKIGRKTAIALAHALNMDYEWIKDGKGHPPVGGTPATVGQGPAVIAQGLPDHRPAPSDAFVLVPKAQARLAASGGLMPEGGLVVESYAFHLDWLSQVITDSRNAVLLQVDGDSMEPLLSNGDTVLIDMGRATVVNGGIYAIGVGDVAQIKRLEQLPKGRIHVTAANPDYHDWIAEPDEIRILGRVVWRAQTLI